MILVNYLIYRSFPVLYFLFFSFSNVTFLEQLPQIRKKQIFPIQMSSESELEVFELMNQECLGQLKINMKAEEVLSILGKPESQSQKIFGR